jgi:hypothetical protein
VATGPFEHRSAGVDELASAVREQVRTPVVLLPLVSGAIGAAVMVVAGLVLQAVLPHASDWSLYSDETDIDLLTAGLGEACAFTMASFDLVGGFPGTIGPPAPMLFLLFPLAGCGVPAFLLARRNSEASSTVLTLSGLAAGIPLALLMLIPALVAGETRLDAEDFSLGFEPAAGAVFALSLLWGALGGAVGAGLGARRRQVGPSTGALPPWAQLMGRTLWASVKPLAALIILMIAVGTIAIQTQVLRDAGHLTEFTDQSKATETLDVALGVINTGVEFTDFSAGVAFHNPPENDPSQLVLPVSKPGAVTGSQSDEPGTDAPDGNYRIFDYGDALPVPAFTALLALMIVPALFALYGGFLMVRVAGVWTAGIGAAVGGSQGLIWGLAMALLSILVRFNFADLVVVGPDGDSVFVHFLLGAALLGALGGFLATQSTAGGPSPPLAPPASPPRSP